MSKDQNLDDLLRERFLDYEQSPPAYLLENILDKVSDNRKRRKLVFMRIVGAAAAILLAFIAGWQLNENTNEVQKLQSATVNAIVPNGEIVHQSDAVSISNEQSGTVASSAVVSSDLVAALKPRDQVPAHRSGTSKMGSSVRSDGESLPMKPMQTLYRLLKSDVAIVKKGHVINIEEKKKILGNLSIDQQIIEQNKLVCLAEKSGRDKSRWAVGASLAPAYRVNRSTQSSQYASNMVSSSSSPMGLDGGISVEYKRGKRLSLQSGVYYSGIGQNSGRNSRSGRNNYEYSLDVSSPNTPVNITNSKMLMNSSAGVIQFDEVPMGIVLNSSFDGNTLATAVVSSNAKLIQNFEYLEIPLYLRYTLFDSKFDVQMIGGFSTNLLVGNKAFVENSSGRSLVGKTQDMESMNYSSTLGIGVKYDLSKRVSINVEPRIKYYLNSLSSNSSVNYKPYSIGVFTGLSYEF